MKPKLKITNIWAVIALIIVIAGCWYLIERDWLPSDVADTIEVLVFEPEPVVEPVSEPGE